MAKVQPIVLLDAFGADVLSSMNRCGAERIPFFFMISYDFSKGVLVSEPDKHPEHLQGLCYQIGQSIGGKPPKGREITARITTIHPEGITRYQERFDIIHKGLMRGDSFLTNLTICTPIELPTGIGLSEIYEQTSAKYKVLCPNRFVCYSPETFVRIRDNKIHTYPMKGTINAELPNATETLLGDYKENCEHSTIVDLMRNDLNRVAELVRVERFKYLELVATPSKSIWQMSSEVVGELTVDWHQKIGNIFSELLPAGSISGAPKDKTRELINKAEGQPRGYYTGICGYYDGVSLDSGVLIRFIEKEDKQYYYRSGGGITINSILEDEYAECLEKIYIPN